MRVGQARKRDAVEKAIVKGLRKAGAMVWPLSAPGLPDLLVNFRKSWHVIEVKDPQRGRLTDAQLNTKVVAPFPVVTTVEEALQVIGAMK